VDVCVYVGVFVFSFFLLLQHAPLHCVIIHSRLVLVHIYIMVYYGSFLFLDVLNFIFCPFHIGVSKYIGSECCKFFLCVCIVCCIVSFCSVIFIVSAGCIQSSYSISWSISWFSLSLVILYILAAYSVFSSTGALPVRMQGASLEVVQ